MNIYVGNLSHETTEDDLRQAFEAFGQVISVKIVRSRSTGESAGFGFVGMPVSDEGKTAISEMNGKDLKGQSIKVEEGRMKADKVVLIVAVAAVAIAAVLNAAGADLATEKATLRDTVYTLLLIQK
jgi:hypothetical protein